MTTPASWFKHAADALVRELLHHEDDKFKRAQKDCDCEDPVPMWTAEDEINLQRRIVAAQEARLRHPEEEVLDFHSS